MSCISAVLSMFFSLSFSLVKDTIQVTDTTQIVCWDAGGVPALRAGVSPACNYPSLDRAQVPSLNTLMGVRFRYSVHSRACGYSRLPLRPPTPRLASCRPRSRRPRASSRVSFPEGGAAALPLSLGALSPLVALALQFPRPAARRVPRARGSAPPVSPEREAEFPPYPPLCEAPGGTRTRPGVTRPSVPSPWFAAANVRNASPTSCLVQPSALCPTPGTLVGAICPSWIA